MLEINNIGRQRTTNVTGISPPLRRRSSSISCNTYGSHKRMKASYFYHATYLVCDASPRFVEATVHALDLLPHEPLSPGLQDVFVNPVRGRPKAQRRRRGAGTENSRGSCAYSYIPGWRLQKGFRCPRRLDRRRPASPRRPRRRARSQRRPHPCPCGWPPAHTRRAPSIARAAHACGFPAGAGA